MVRKEENKMNELILLSKEYISKEDFIFDVSIPNHHFELGGDNDQLWLIDNESDLCIVRIDLILKDEFGNIIIDELDDELYEGTNAPYKGLLYSIEYRNEKVLKQLLSQINKENRCLYVEYNASNKFKKI